MADGSAFGLWRRKPDTRLRTANGQIADTARKAYDLLGVPSRTLSTQRPATIGRRDWCPKVSAIIRCASGYFLVMLSRRAGCGLSTDREPPAHRRLDR